MSLVSGIRTPPSIRTVLISVGDQDTTVISTTVRYQDTLFIRTLYFSVDVSISKYASTLSSLRGLKEGEERLSSGKDIPTFIPRTYLWSRRDSTPPKLIASLEGGARGYLMRGSSLGGEVSAIAEEWKQLETSRQRVVSIRERSGSEVKRVKQGKDITQIILSTR